MPFSVIKNVIDNFPCDELIFTGGEPLLRFDLIKRTQEYVVKRGKRIQFSIRTNGTILNNYMAAFLRQHNFSCIVSLDGPKSCHDKNRRFKGGASSYDVVLRYVKQLKDMGLNLSINYTVTPETATGLASDLLLFLKENKITTYVGYVIPDNPITTSQLRTYIKEVSIFVRMYLKHKLFLVPPVVYPFDMLFFKLLYMLDLKIISLRCEFRKRCVSPEGVIYMCNSYLFIPPIYHKRLQIGNALQGQLDQTKITFFVNRFNLSQWHVRGFGTKSNQFCYLQCKKPESRFFLEFNTRRIIQCLFEDYFKKLNMSDKETLKNTCLKKHKKIFKNNFKE
jgi:sulfatase maturation enzyme AslB (radical SAM superfamily)